MIKKGLGTTDGLIQDLSQRKSIDLQRATSEALAYISYLKRFAQKD
jgi:CRISPR/Cas system CMR-associated protein Cmr5 small subunit